MATLARRVRVGLRHGPGHRNESLGQPAEPGLRTGTGPPTGPARADALWHKALSRNAPDETVTKMVRPGGAGKCREPSPGDRASATGRSTGLRALSCRRP